MSGSASPTISATEFKKRLGQLHETYLRGINYYTVWLRIQYYDADEADWSLDEQNEVLHSFVGFFKPVGIALQEALFLQFAKIFDSDSRTSSLPNLLDLAKSDPSLTPNCSSADIAKLESDLNGQASIVSGLTQMRNQRLAHDDSSSLPASAITKADLDKFIEVVGDTFNSLSVAHDDSFYSWQYMRKQASSHTLQLIGSLLKGTDS